MPLTPFHWGMLAFGFLLFDLLYLPALFVSSVIIDIEPAYNLFVSPNSGGTLHGFFHTFFGATIVALLTGFCLVRFRSKIDSLAKALRVEQPKVTTKAIYATSLLAVYSHVLLDSIMHSDVKPFWPVSDANPLLHIVPITHLYFLTSALLVIAAGLYFNHLRKQLE